MAAAGIQEPPTSSSSSSSSSCNHTYQVFLSFRGKDTRKGFTDHLYAALKQAGVHTFRDDDEMPRGEEIEIELKKAIQESRISLIVFSTSYATSRWCLDELVMIMERRRSSGHKVVPVFYDVEPTQVRKQNGSYGKAFAEHEKRFEKEMDRVEGWRAALKEVADLGGMVLGDGYESQFVETIVNEIQNQLRRKVMVVDSYLPGIESRVAAINLWVQDESEDAGVAIIHGVGGIGKGTIAKTFYNQNFEKFEAGSFLSNVRETCEQPNGMVRLQSQLLSDITGKSNKINNVHEGIIKIKEAVTCKRVLVVIDDLDQSDQYDALVGNQEWFSPGSKIIITARHMSILKLHKVNRTFQVDLLDGNESLQLFSRHAFGQDHPIESYINLAKAAVHLCRGLPLALQVLGSSLSGKGIDVWESALRKVDVIPDSRIQKILSVSYDSLQDDHNQNMFLDIACFFVGMNKDYVVSILDSCDYFTLVGIQDLIDRSLIALDEENKLTMHSFLRVMAQEIVRQECPGDPGKRSRLWCYNDAFAVLSENTGTATVKGLNFNQHIIKEDNFNQCTAKRCRYQDYDDKPRISKRPCVDLFSWKLRNTGSDDGPDVVQLKTWSFAKMQNLKFLLLNYVKVQGEYGQLPKSLVWLSWRGFSLKCIPDNFHLPKLAVLDMSHSSIINVWKGRRFFPELKILNLSHCHGLVKTPDLTGLPSLERLKLKHCTNLVEVGESTGKLQRLVFLNLKDCINLKNVPTTIQLLRSLKTLDLSGCSKLELMPNEFGEVDSSSVTCGDRTSMYDSHDNNASFYSTFLSWLLTKNNPKSITFSLSFLPCSLIDLHLADCNISEFTIPHDLSFLHSLESLDLAGNPTRILPESIKSLTRLRRLCLDRCTKLQSLPELPPSLKELSAEGCTSLERITKLPNLLRTSQVVLSGCTQLVEVEGLFKLEPITNVDTEIINDLELFNLGSADNIEMTICNAMANCERKTSPQVLHECGILSSYLLGPDIPSRFRHKNHGSSISFDVTPLPGHNICGLNLCALYTHDDLTVQFFPGGCYARVMNETKGTTWAYSPTFFSVPKANEDMLWLSHWKIGDQMEAGDLVNVSLHLPPGFHVKECGICIVYEQKEKGSQSTSKEIAQSSSVRYQNISDRDLSAHQVGTAAYFLCHHPFGIPDQVLRLT